MKKTTMSLMMNLTNNASREEIAEGINDFIESQLAVWPLAADNFKSLGKIERKLIKEGDFPLYAQYNPSRIISTGAKTDPASIARRPCFLCAQNRPEQQYAIEILPGWELLLNPYPIFAVHFTIAAKLHIEQGRIPLDMVSMAEKMPGMAIFFNGARAGASAPDHQHAQAVVAMELPLLRMVEEFHPSRENGFKNSKDLGIKLPFHFISSIIPPDKSGMEMLRKISRAFGIDADSGCKDHGLLNAFFWTDASGLMRCVIVPRRRHRPACYLKEGEERFMISPGAIDMTGIFITPRKEDFERLEHEKANEIYREVAFPDNLPEEIIDLFTL